MKVTFLGTGGGRFVTSQQLLATGGFVLELDGERLHIDPGPGALVRAKQYGVKLNKLTGVIITHAHPDHCTDAQVVIEAMTDGTIRKRGILIGNQTAFNGSRDGGFLPILSQFHQSCVEKKFCLRPGETAAAGKVTVTATPTRHSEPHAIGLVMEGTERIGYTGDTEYLPELGKLFSGCDLLIVNCPQPRKNAWPMYLNSESTARLLQEAQPRAAIIQHFSMRMIRAGPVKETAWIARQWGGKTVMARDGMVWTEKQ